MAYLRVFLGRKKKSFVSGMANISPHLIFSAPGCLILIPGRNDKDGHFRLRL